MAQEPIVTVWIDYGCILCGHCEAAAPMAFRMTDWTAQILGDLRVDGATDENSDHSPLRIEVVGLHDDAIVEAAESCPVEVIKFSRDITAITDS